ncbi:MAG: Holliday junction resolvase RuvX [Gammaproteobacteria bacterium]|nr:Holliday junction resolvase RuvX [Gammaproteobacteria bacterium]
MSEPATTALVFDHGGRRIGVALASRSPRLASPLTTLAARSGVPDWPEVEKLVREWCPGCLVVGVPYNEPGRRINSGGNSANTDSESAAERFAAELEDRWQLPVIRVDERLSSAEAEYRLRDQRRSGLRQRKVRSGDVDAVAACVIAESWLDLPAPKN